MKDPAYRKEYDALEEEFALIVAVAKARARGLEPGPACQTHEDDPERDCTA